jgi:hypothetical protein
VELSGNIELQEFVLILGNIIISLALLVVFGKMWSA